MTPQPEPNEIAVVHRSYTKLKLDNNYKKKSNIFRGGWSKKQASCN